MSVRPQDGVMMDAMCLFHRFVLISLRYFHQLDATWKVMHRHEIICPRNTAQFNPFFCTDNAVAAQLALKSPCNSLNENMIATFA